MQIPNGLDNLLFVLLGDLYQGIKHRLELLVKPGLYEVLDYQTTLDLHDTKGKEAKISKIEKVEFLQDNIIAYQDQAWGDGKILQNYQCSPGIPVDQYRSGHKTIILISLRGIKNKGDIEEFRTTWKMKNGFLKSTGFWETSINHSTKRVTVTITFPYSRPPRRVFLLENNKQTGIEFKNVSILQLADKRWQLRWSKVNPRLHENYILKWVW